MVLRLDPWQRALGAEIAELHEERRRLIAERDALKARLARVEARIDSRDQRSTENLPADTRYQVLHEG